MNEEKRIIEINGVKMEVDLRKATVIENYKIGDMVKVLNRQYANDYKVSPGVITDFFYREKDGKPEGAIQILVLEESYSTVDLKFIVYGEQTKDISIAPFNSYEMKLPIEGVIARFDKMIEKSKEEILVLESKKKAYLELFAEVLGK